MYLDTRNLAAWLGPSTYVIESVNVRRVGYSDPQILNCT